VVSEARGASPITRPAIRPPRSCSAALRELNDTARDSGSEHRGRRPRGGGSELGSIVGAR
jgi:hypothetical protein